MKPTCWYITEVDHTILDGATISDRKIIRLLEKTCHVRVLHLQIMKYITRKVAFPKLFYDVLKSRVPPHSIIFTRGLIVPAYLIMLRKLFKYKIVYITVPSIPFPSIEIPYRKMSKAKKIFYYFLYRFLETVVPKHTDVPVTAIERHARAFTALGIPEEKIVTLPMFVEEQFFKYKPKLKSKDFVICYSGSFSSYMRLEELICAMNFVHGHIPEARLILIGDGPIRPILEEKVRKENLGSVVSFLGLVPHSRMVEALGKASIFAYFTTRQGMSSGMLEAAALGRPILTYKADPAYDSFFKHEKSIFYVEKIDPEVIAKAIIHLHETPLLLRRIGEGARNVALQNFNPKTAEKKLQRIIERFSDSY